MTTLLGIVSESGEHAVVLSSDLSGTRSNWSPQGDVAYRRQTKEEIQKIYVDDRGEIALGVSGIFDNHYQSFLAGVLSGKINLREAIEKGFFQEFANSNLNRWEYRYPNLETANSLLIATRFDNKPMLYTCWPLGKIESRVWTSIGSGSEYASEHISKSGKLIPERISLDEAIDLSAESLKIASKDIYTGGLDLVVVTPNSIHQFGERIKNSLEDSKRNTIASIKNELAQKSK